MQKLGQTARNEPKKWDQVESLVWTRSPVAGIIEKVFQTVRALGPRHADTISRHSNATRNDIEDKLTKRPI
ncbi:unnamed protein product [Protopolystoma xenopodis]|uniref:Uncharacterized protein n=1 Tax=Protopolystoma xenopodis TaxID=117903 RepID=A0A448WAC7_9PLAT|nr:unnamed protein product [Protopolystoma xenopodis]